MAVIFVEHLRMMGIASCLDDGERGVGAFGGGKMLIEDRTVAKEICNVRHARREACACNIP